jgi:hypothetical protein
MRAEFSGKRGLCSCNRRELAHFAARSLQLKIPFLTYFQRPVRSLRGEQAVWSRSSPPSSLRKPHVSDTTPDRAFVRGFSASHFPDFGLCGRSSVLAAILGALSLHQKIPFPAARGASWPQTAFAPAFRFLDHCHAGSLIGARKAAVSHNIGSENRNGSRRCER